MTTREEGEEVFAVVGGEGFLGAAIVDALLERYPPRRVASFGLTQRRFAAGPDGDGGEYRFFRCDITSLESVRDALERSGATTVFHTASPHANATSDVWHRVNVGGTKTLVEALQERHRHDQGKVKVVRKLVFTSSATVVFDGSSGLKNVDERLETVNVEGDARGEPTYVSTKAKAEKIVLDANGHDGLLTCSLRLGGIIGPGDRQVIPGFIDVYKAYQSTFQMGRNENLFDFVTVRNVVHAHLLAAERLLEDPSAPPLDDGAFDERMRPVSCTVKRRTLPTSKRPDVNAVRDDDDSLDCEPPLPAGRTRWNQFYGGGGGGTNAKEARRTTTGRVAGQAFFISNGEPVPFWSFARAVYHAYSGHATPFVVALPATMGMLVATLCEWAGRLIGKRPEECAVNRKYMQYVLNDMYFDIERARRLLGYEPIESLEEGIRSAVEWYKQDEERTLRRQRESSERKQS